MSDAGDIYAALAAVMADCTAVAKRDRNEHQNFMFRGIDAVVNAVGPILRTHGVIVVPNVENVHYDLVQTSTGKGATACRVLVTYTFYAGDGSSIDTRVAAEAWDHGDKAAPKAMSVAFRTALLQALALPTDDADPDSQSYEHAKVQRTKAPQTEPDPWRDQPAPPTNGVTPAQLKTIGRLMSVAKITDRADALVYVREVVKRADDAPAITSRNDLTKAEASTLIRALEADVKAQSATKEPADA